MPLDPRTTARVDTFLAFSLEMQVRLREHYRQLQAEGWTESQAWEWVRRTEDRLLNPWYDEYDDDPE